MPDPYFIFLLYNFPEKIKKLVYQKTLIDSVTKKTNYSYSELTFFILNQFLENPENVRFKDFVTKIDQGTNHNVFKVRYEEKDYLVKIAPLKNSYRLEQEFLVLDFLNKQKQNFSPKPILFQQIDLQSTVLIESWMPGDVLTAPPRDRTEWENILHHYLDIHAIQPSVQTMYLPKAVKNANTKYDCVALVKKQLNGLENTLLPVELKSVLRTWEEKLDIRRSDQEIRLCRGDGNFTNFILQGQRIVSVDWEYGGWGAPLFDLVSLLAHPSYVALSFSEMLWAIEYYQQFHQNKNLEKTILSYLLTQSIYWAARYINLLHNTDPHKPYAWRDRPSLRLQNYKSYLNRVTFLMNELM